MDKDMFDSGVSDPYRGDGDKSDGRMCELFRECPYAYEWKSSVYNNVVTTSWKLEKPNSLLNWEGAGGYPIRASRCSGAMEMEIKRPMVSSNDNYNTEYAEEKSNFRVYEFLGSVSNAEALISKYKEEFGGSDANYQLVGDAGNAANVNTVPDEEVFIVETHESCMHFCKYAYYQWFINRPLTSEDLVSFPCRSVTVANWNHDVDGHPTRSVSEDTNAFSGKTPRCRFYVDEFFYRGGDSQPCYLEDSKYAPEYWGSAGNGYSTNAETQDDVSTWTIYPSWDT